MSKLTQLEKLTADVVALQLIIGELLAGSVRNSKAWDIVFKNAVRRLDQAETSAQSNTASVFASAVRGSLRDVISGARDQR